MKRIALYITAAIITCATYAQILAPIGAGLPAAPDKIANHKSGIVVAYDDRDNIINVQIWNGDFWNVLPTPDLPKTNSSTTGEYRIIDLISFEEDIYLMTGYTQKSIVSEKNSILKWDGNEWENLSDPNITSSLALTKLFVENNAIKCIGKFKDGTIESNIVTLQNNQWIPEGNLITSNITRDNFTSIVSTSNQVLATGTFTNPTNNNLSLVKWDGTSWSLSDFPPFLEKNISLGSYQDKVVVYGKSSFATSPIKISQGSNWTDLNAGLENYTVENVSQFAELNGQLLALGTFVNNETQEENILMLYDGTTWSPSNINLDNIDQIYTAGSTVALSGDFDDNGILRGIGKVSADKAQVITRVFEDKNGNCTKESEENWLTDYPVSLNEADIIFSENNGIIYAQLEKNKAYTLNAEPYRHFVPTCPAISLEAQEYQTYYTTALGARQKLGILDAQIYLTDKDGDKYVPAETKSALLCVTNMGTELLEEVIVSLELPQGISNFSSDVDLFEINESLVTWKINLAKGENICIGLKYNLDGFDEITLNAMVDLSENAVDQNLSNNKSTFTYSPGQNRPNSKYCLNGKMISPTVEHLRYKITINNTNAATINGITVVDELDSDIIISQKGISYTTSHGNAQVKTRSERGANEHGQTVTKLITTIEGISIPPKNENDGQASAFVDYTLNIRSDLMDKDAEICNTAKIYFSFANGVYGEATNTNTVCSYYSEVLGVTNGSTLPSAINGLEIGPNPVSDIVTITNSKSETVHLTIVNNLAQDITKLDVRKHSENEINVSNYAPGVYFIYANGLFAKKIVIR